jgi:hypothetical protein
LPRAIYYIYEMKIRLVFITLILFSFTSDEIPVTNRKVLEYVKTVIGKKVDRGECWDLANQALTYANAKWEFPTKFGKPVNYKTEMIIPGDIIQINNVTMESKTATSIVRWKMKEHTAILFDVKENGKVMVAEQNVNGMRKVQVNEWNLNDVKSGKMQFYRPQPN